MTEAQRLLERTLEHCEELRQAWERGALDEHDGKGGTRSNRNYDLVIELERFLAQPMTTCEGELVAALEKVSWHGIDGDTHWGSKLTDDHTESMCKSLCVPARAALAQGKKT